MSFVFILQFLLSSIHEWVPMIRSQFCSIQVFNMKSDSFPPWLFSWNVYYDFYTNTFVIGCISNAVLIRTLLSHMLNKLGYWNHPHVQLHQIHSHCQYRNQPQHHQKGLCHPTVSLIINQTCQSAISCLDQ